MKNFINEGDTLDVVAPTGGVTVALKTTGVFEFPKNQNEAWTVGQKVYWDTTNLWATITTGGSATTVIGRVAEPNANPSAVGRVLLSRSLV